MKTRYFNRVLSLFLALIMAAALLPLTAFANDLNYTREDGGDGDVPEEMVFPAYEDWLRDALDGGLSKKPATVSSFAMPSAAAFVLPSGLWPKRQISRGNQTLQL